MSKQHIVEIEHYFDETRQANELMQNASTSQELRRAWESCLSNFGKTIGRAINLGMKNSASKGWANCVKNLSTKDDEGLVYLREARNSAEHSLVPSADYRDASVSLEHEGINIVMDGDSRNITFEDNFINGGKVVDGTINVSISDGKIEQITDSGSATFVSRPAEIRLADIVSEEKGTRFSVPAGLSEMEIAPGLPSELANAGLECLGKLISELKQLHDW